ncbi:importin subunit alpha-5-like isoform X3 [Daphnia carinata]|uniref:importin subunit alpha-5-like isoform X3 n=1 Tax=Daphnia carinata TaxID=120202 RepID=UPI00257FB5EF|nr:importin subunit alpha-5-like isoform X3 [Daphnia carinata]
MPSEANPSRLKDFKNKGRDVEEMRRRRTEVNVELRKAKKEDHLLKRRNLEVDDEPLSPLQEQNRMAAANMSIDDIVNGINSGDENKEITATHAARKILSRERNPPIDILINANVVPKLVEFLSRVTNPDLQFESAWALSNIASGTSDQTKAVVNAGAVAGFISLLASPYPVVARQAVWALGNIAGDGPELRDHVIEQGIIKPLLGLIKPDTPATFLRDVTWTLCNLCRNENHPPSVPAVRQLLPALAHLIQNTDIDILADACWAIFFLTDGPNERIQEVVDAGVVPRLVALLGHPQAAVITPNLRTIGNIVTGSDTQTDSVLAAGACPLLAKLLEHSTNDTVKEAARTVSNISTRFLIHIVVTETVAFVLAMKARTWRHLRHRAEISNLAEHLKPLKEVSLSNFVIYILFVCLYNGKNILQCCPNY